MDPRIELLAKNLVNFSVAVKKEEHVLIDAQEVPDAIVVALIRAVRKKKAFPHVVVRHPLVQRELYMKADKQALELQAANELNQMKKIDAYIALRGSNNIFELSDVPSKSIQMVGEVMKPVLDWRVKKTRWVVLRWPNPAMAQQSSMSTEAFEDFYFKVCTLDYARMKPGMEALRKLMNTTDRVEIKSSGTDLRFSIKGIPAISCGGNYNIPDGEVFTAPVKTSVEGHITYNAPTIYNGVSFEGVRLEFKKGKVIKATSRTNQKKLNDILNSDGGARFIGEFAIGFNPHINHPMQDILFDEKINGSFHFTPGQAYEDADNGNRSQVHWDMVSIQRKDYGGGEIYFDGKLIRKDGLFVPKSLNKLNPDYLIGN